MTNDLEGIHYLKEKLAGYLEPEVAEGLETIISTVEETKEADLSTSLRSDACSGNVLLHRYDF